MDFDVKETLKVAFAIVGGILLVYQSFAVVTQNAPLRAVVNPHRRAVLLAGLAVLSVGYTALAVLAGNKWMPEDVWAVMAPLFNQEPTPFRVVASAGALAVGLIVLAGSALFCYAVYPRDPRTFAPRERYPKAIGAAAKDALYHYTNRPGGLEYAGVIVLPADGTVPTAEALIDSATADVTTGGYRLIECLDRGDMKRHDRKWLRRKADKDKLRERRLGWLTLATTALVETRRVGAQARACDLGEVSQVRTRSHRGGLLFEYLLPRKDGEPEVILFGVTTSADEVENGRLELHFSMLKDALGQILRTTDDLGAVPTPPPPSAVRTGTHPVVPVG